MSFKDSDRIIGLIKSVEERQIKTQEFLREKRHGLIDETILQLATSLCVSENKGREYFMKALASHDIIRTKNRWDYWEWAGAEDPEETGTEYMKRRDKEKENKMKNEIRQRLQHERGT